MFCANCGMQIEDGAPFCGRCGKAQHNPAPLIENRGHLNVPERSTRSRNTLWAILGSLAAICVITVAVGDFSKTTSQGERTASDTPIPGQLYIVKGTEATGSVLAFDSEESLNQAIEAARVNDRYGFNQIAASGHAFQIPDGSSVLILDASGLRGWCKVRVEDGVFYGNIAYLLDTLTSYHSEAKRGGG